MRHAVALAGWLLALASAAEPEWDLNGLGDPEAEADAGEWASHAPVKISEVRAACPAEIKACEKVKSCKADLKQSFDPESEPLVTPHKRLIEVMKCFGSGNSPEAAARTAAAAERFKNTKKITDDIACEYCGHLVRLPIDFSAVFSTALRLIWGCL